MRHRRLFDVRVRHDYHPGGQCPDLQIEPRTWLPSGVRALERHRLRVRPLPDGFEVVGPVDDEEHPVVRYGDDLLLSFDVRVTAADFPYYTDLDAWEGGRPTYRGSGSPGGALVLADDSPPQPPDVAAGIEITGITDAWLAEPPRFTLDLHARQIPWAYYLLTARPNGVLPEIRDGDLQRNLQFPREQLTLDSLAPADDPVGHRLLVRHPERRCFRFTSLVSIACRRAPLRQLALHLGEEILIRELQNPSIHNRATIKVAPDEAPREFLYRVTEY